MRDVVDQARHGTLPGMVLTGATVADAAADHVRRLAHERAQAIDGPRLPIG